MPVTAPAEEQLFALQTSGMLDRLARLPGFEDAQEEMVTAILDGANALANDRFAALHAIGDTEGARWSTEGVTLPKGFAAAYQAYVEGGWGSLSAAPEAGGQGLPAVLGVAVQEQLASANMAFQLCMMLTLGGIEALSVHGSDDQKALYLPRIVSGEWTATMNLTEPQAGSDVGAVRTSATPADGDAWHIKGSKIFITWGEHDLAANIVHLVLARTPDAPAGTKGLSLFLVPKFLPDTDGTPGARNGVDCAAIEHKLGIHASPTCTMIFGEAQPAIGWLVGPRHGGIAAMFTMMNHARLNVGLEGVAIAERAYRDALAFARERVQSAGFDASREPQPILAHADVRRMLMTMRARAEGCRALVYHAVAALDIAHADPDPAARADAKTLADLLTPIAKAFATDSGVEAASLGIQIGGGMGYIEETGLARHLRDARIAPIYEGTNGIQALDLVGRKLRMDGGVGWRAFIEEMAAGAIADGELTAGAKTLARAVATLRETAGKLYAMAPAEAAGGATPFLRMFGLTVTAHLLLQQAKVAATRIGGGDDTPFLRAKIATARFACEQLLPEMFGLVPAATGGTALLYPEGDPLFAG
ncbi:acyl-CoA dehydrogenase family protein [Sphingomonas abietis]|uniref:Acyl-CoA dehydrogenase family protein n=1 Tax=Sphingomonas abietis TaxID=3012344 RepID=A0ABY7NK03_9SPHN|nr:acyl-CoA dehydrogenase family protein [Sphingomonas abietis]WBO21290.1 acyl-CoA dehydrogenase family protein [Sphingomonas abietis]